MSFNLRNRSFLKELDFTPDELRFLLKLSAELKAAKYGSFASYLKKGLGVTKAELKQLKKNLLTD